jgi:hypothetical protein
VRAQTIRRIEPCPHQIAHRLVPGIRNPYRGQLACPVPFGQHGGVPARPDPVVRSLRAQREATTMHSGSRSGHTPVRRHRDSCLGCERTIRHDPPPMREARHRPFRRNPRHTAGRVAAISGGHVVWLICSHVLYSKMRT